MQSLLLQSPGHSIEKMDWNDIGQMLLLLSGDVELNPGPPKKAPIGPSGAPKGPSKEEQLQVLENKVREYEEKLDRLERKFDDQQKEMIRLKEIVLAIKGMDDKVQLLTSKVDAISGVYDDLHEKMHEMDKTRKNNLLFYGIRPDFLPEIQFQLEQKIHEIIKNNLQISRDVPITKITRMLTGPEVRGCRPVLVNFAYWKDREEVLSKSKLLRGSNIYVTEDISRKIRETRHELTRFMREVRTKSPTKRCVIRYDKLYIDNTPYVYDEDRNTIIRYFAPEQQRPMSRNNYSSLGDMSAGLMRSTSVPSVNGDHNSFPGHGSLTGRRGDSASSESLHLASIPYDGHSQPSLDENAEVGYYNEMDEAPSPALFESGANPDYGNVAKLSTEMVSQLKSKKEKVQQKVETLQLTKKEKRKKAENGDAKPSAVSDIPDPQPQ